MLHDYKPGNMKKISFCLFLVLLTICSCKKTQDGVPQEHLSEDILSSAKILKTDTVMNVADFFPAAKCFYHYNDSIIMVFNRGSEQDGFLKFFNVNQKKEVLSLFLKGNGPEELLLPAIEMGSDNLLVRDVQVDKLFSVNVDSLLEDSLYTFPMIKNQNFRISNLCLFNERIVAVNPFTFIDEKQHVEQDCGQKIVTIDDLEDLYTQNHKYNTINVASSGELLANNDLKKLVFACSGQSFIELYDDELNVIKRIYGPKDLDVRYHISDEGEVVYKGKIPYTYLASCKNDTYFYLYYMGDFWNMDTTTMDEHKGYILKFDWDGNFVDSYLIDRYVYALSCDKKFKGSEVLYVSVNDEDGLPALLKLYE